MRATIGTIRVLIIENDAADAELLGAALHRSLDVSTLIAASRDDVVRAVGNAEFDVVLSDFRMNGWTGLDALAMLRERGVDAPFILVTGTLGDERAAECIRVGVADYILKDNLARLPLAVARVVEEQRNRRKQAETETRLRLAERQRREREEQFAQLADHISEVFFVVDAQFGETVYLNPAFEAIWGRTRESVYASPASFLEGVLADDRPSLIDSIRRVQAGADGGRIEFRVVQPDGTMKWVLSHAIPIRNEAGEVYRISGVALDITEHRHLEEQFRQAQKMEALGQLAGGVAHDFNNLLTIITGFTAMVQATLIDDEKGRQRLEHVLRAASDAAGLTRQLLAFSRRQVVVPHVIALEEVVGQYKAMLSRVIREDITLVTRHTGRSATTLIDPGQVEQVIMNLAVNARDAMPSGGQLTLESAVVDRGSVTCLPEGAEAGTWVVLRVSDTGTGIDAATQARMFEPFFTTKPLGTGTGLGLATVYGIVNQAGGTISVDSTVGQGTTFSVYLPYSAQPRGEGTPPPQAVSADGTEVVLLVEDSAALRRVLQIALERYGYTVIVAPTAHAAVEIARSDAPIDMLLTDVVMPGLSGRDVAEQFAAARPSRPILYMSGYTDDGQIQRAVLSSTVDYIEKPFTPQTIAEKVRAVLDRAAQAR